MTGKCHCTNRNLESKNVLDDDVSICKETIRVKYLNNIMKAGHALA